MFRLQEIEEARDAVRKLRHPKAAEMLPVFEKVFRAVNTYEYAVKQHGDSPDDHIRQNQAFALQQLNIMIERVLATTQIIVRLDAAL